MTVSRNGTHVMTEYPKWIEKDGEPFLVQSEEHEMELDNEGEKANMVEELKGLGHDVDLRSYKGVNGFGALKAFYVAVMKGGKNGDSE